MSALPNFVDRSWIEANVYDATATQRPQPHPAGDREPSLRGIACLGMVFRRTPVFDRQSAAARERLIRDLPYIAHIFQGHIYRDGVTLGMARTTDDFPLNP